MFAEQHLSLLPESLSDKYRKDHRRVRGLFDTVCELVGLHALNHAMVRKCIAERLKGAKICRGRLCNWGNLPDRATFHDLRKTFCTALAEAGVNQKLCQTLAGHASSQTTGHFYRAVIDPAARATASRIRFG